jgi:hypothetical protein
MGLAVIAIAIFVYLWARRFRQIYDRKQLIFLVIGYFVWASNVLTGRFEEYYQYVLGDEWFSFVPALIAILYTLFIPLVFRD